MRQKLKQGNEGVRDYISDHAHILIVTDWLATQRGVSLICRGFSFFKYNIILEVKANFTVRRHILVFYFFLLLTGVMRKEKGGKRGKKKMDERQDEREQEGGEVEERMEERTEEGTEEGTQETEERLEFIEECCGEEEVSGGFRESLGSQESQGLCNFH